VPLPIIINGALGKMGAAIAAIALDDKDIELRAAIERSGHPKTGEDYGLCIGKGTVDLRVTDSWNGVDVEEAVIIDFSSPQSTRFLLDGLGGEKTRIVIGTTGLTDADIACAKKAAERMPVLVSPNMSLGVNLLFSLTERVSASLKNDFDIEIIEAHHRFKKDSPSGTARRLGEIVVNAYGGTYEQTVRNGRSGIQSSDRPKNEVGIHAVRGGDIIGDHTVLFAGLGERIELRHMAHNRSPLARGALTAAKWIADKKHGYYSMKDVLGI
jgi:4-hydroxy-tetrahydrodipicolinate reductase